MLTLRAAAPEDIPVIADVWYRAAVALIRRGERTIGERFERTRLAVVSGNARARRFYAREGWSDAGSFEYLAQVDGGSIAVPSHRYEKHAALAGTRGPGSCAS